MKTGAAFLGCSKYGDKSDKCNYSLPVLGPDWAYFRNSLTKGIDQGLPRDMGTHPDLGYRQVTVVGCAWMLEPPGMVTDAIGSLFVPGGFS